MVKTLLIFAYFWFYMVFNMVFLPGWLVLSLPGLRRFRKPYVGFVTRLWAKQFLLLVGAKVSVEGIGNVPVSDNVCFIGNHQSALDILLILAYSGKTPGFIAKRELIYAPFLNFWMMIIHCVFIERRNIRRSLAAIDRGVESLKKGYPMAIFPEGTRSRDGRTGDFKPGSFKLATRAEALIVPVTLVNTADLYEKTGRFRTGNVRVIFHPPIPAGGLSPGEKKSLPDRVRTVIIKALPETGE